MRPLELRVRDFRSYQGDETVIDFRGRRLLGIVGPIGSGKSSILDAISFALYGRTPSVAAGTKALIHQRADGGVVTLRFEIEGEVWEATRALRRKGQSQHSLRRFEADTADAPAVEKVTLEADVNERIVDLLGLEFDAFSRSVMLAQNRFAEFLRSRPSERDSVLKGVFGHDRVDAMRAAAKKRQGELDVALELLAAEVARLDDLEARIADRRRDRDEIEERVESLRKAEPAYTELTEQIDAAGARAASLQTRSSELTAAGERLPDESVATAVITQAGEADSERARLGDELARAQEALGEAERAGSEVQEHLGPLIDEGSQLLASQGPHSVRAAEAGSRVSQLEQHLIATQEEVVALAGTVAQAEATLERAELQTTDAGDARAAAEAAVHDARHADMAQALRTQLVAGEPCPVCEQPVSVLPRYSESSALESAETELSKRQSVYEASASAEKEAQRSLEQARAKLEAAEAGQRSSASELEAATETAHRAAEDLRAIDERVSALLGDGDPGERLEAMRRELEQGSTRSAEARRSVERIRHDHDAAIRAQQEAARKLAELSAALAEVAIRISGEDEAIPAGSGVDGVAAALEEVRSGWAAALEQALSEMAAARAERDAAISSQDAMLAELNLEGDLPTALAREEARLELVGAELEREVAAVAGAAGIREELERLTASRDVYRRLATDLTDSRFVRYLLDDERARLADLGSEHFQRLSSGRYRFTADGKFDVVDLTAADAVRKADSLSGGETFLASLGLALALAEMVSRTGGRLDAFFLDEGFGALDPEHLDLAMEGIEHLVAETSSRLVVIVSHVPELRHRLEDLIVLDRSPLTGDTRVLRS